MKKILFGTLMVVSSVALYAQQRPHYTMYMANPYLVNPAMAGSEDYVDLKAGYRTQWQGWEGAPVTSYFSAHAPIGKPHTEYHHYSDNKNWLGLGGKVLNDQTGPITTFSGLATVTYDFGITKGFGFGGLAHRDGIRASVGVDLGVQQYNFDPSKFLKPETQEIVASDPILNGNGGKIKPDANFGIWVYQDNLFYLGFSSMQIIRNDISLKYDDVDVRNEVAKLSRHYFLTAGYTFLIAQDFGFSPSFMMKVVGGASPSWDINGKFDYMRGQYWGAFSYRHGDALNLLVGTAINYRYEIAYSYDITTSAIRKYSNGSHEIMVGYRIPFKFRTNNPGEHSSRMKKHKSHHW